MISNKTPPNQTSPAAVSRRGYSMTDPSPVRVHGSAVEMVPIADLVPFERNAREHPPEQIEVLRRNYREFGFTQPLVIDQGNLIIGGHGRLIAAELEGMIELPCVRVSGLTDAQVRALRLSDNQIALLSSWDLPELRLELLALKTDGLDLRLTGFTPLDLMNIAFEPRGADPEATPEPPANPVTRLGDVWLLGPHRIACGDCTDQAAVGAALGGASPHLMVTDPPYGVEYDADWRNRQIRPNGRKHGSRAIGKVTNDDQADWRQAWVLFPGDVAYVWAAGLTSDAAITSLEACGLMPRSHLIWNKNVAVISRGHYHFKHEVLWYAVRDGKTGHWQGDKTQTSVWDIAKPHASETGHSTQKPVECMKRPIENNSKQGDAVYDPFIGSGTTAIAAHMLGRHCLGIEISPAYVDIATLRLMEFSGEEAFHEDGRSWSEVKAERLGSAAR